MQEWSKGGTTVGYAYGADGIRTEKTVNGVTTEYFVADGVLLGAKMGNEWMVFTRDNQGTIIGFTVQSNGYLFRYYYEYNLQGDVVALYNASKAILAKYKYDAWGKLLSVTDASGTAITSATHIANINPIRYRGYFYDPETGFYYLNSRYYDPETGRFINADAYLNANGTIVGYNRFAYCDNNPVMCSDPSGQSVVLSCIIVGTIIGSLIGGHFIGSSAKNSEDENISSNWGWYAAAGVVGGGLVGGLTGWGVGVLATGVGAAATGTAATATAPIVEQVVEKTSTTLQTYYPPNNGFSGAIEKVTLDVGTIIQRTGDFVGRFAAPAGTPTQMLSLPYDKIDQVTTYLQTSQPIQALSGKVAPWFGQIGGGIQYLLLDGRIDQLLAEGILKILGE